MLKASFSDFKHECFFLPLFYRELDQKNIDIQSQFTVAKPKSPLLITNHSKNCIEINGYVA